MTNRSWLLVATLIAAPAEAKEPRSIDRTHKTADELAACITLRLADVRGYHVTRDVTPTGQIVKMKFSAAGIAATAATFVIQDQGSERVLTIFATGKATGFPRTIAQQIRSCAT